MNSKIKDQLTPAKRRRQILTDVVALALAVVLGTAFVAGAADKRKGERGDKEQRKQVPNSDEIESRGGLKVKGVELVADGGLVLVRYTVLDPDKLEKVKNKEGQGDGPTVENRRNNKSLVPSGGMRHNHKLRPGQTDFTLYQNTDGAVQKGDKIDLVVEGATMKDVPVE